MRTALAILLGAAAAALGALILGEYEFTGTTPFVAGILFGFAIAEVMLGIARARSVGLGIGAALASAAGLLWAGFITVRRRDESIPSGAWIAAVLGVITGYARAGALPWQRGPGRPQESAPASEEVGGG